MIREKTQIKLTDTDYQRFTFHHVEDERTNGILRNLRTTYRVTTAVLMTLLFVMIILLTKDLPKGWDMLIICLLVLVLFVIFTNYSIYRTNVNTFSRNNHYIEITVLEKLPLETETARDRLGKEETYTFFPVRGRDTTRKNYTSVCYLPGEEYRNCKIGDKQKLYVEFDEFEIAKQARAEKAAQRNSITAGDRLKKKAHAADNSQAEVPVDEVAEVSSEKPAQTEE